jgi:death-on-curing protein
MRPQQLWAYSEEQPSISDLAASIGFGLARNHPFIDGNKRTAYAAILSFLYENGAYLDVSELEAERVMVNVASGLMPEALFASWISANILAIED